MPNSTRTLSGAGLVVLLLGMFLPMTDFFIVNVALPTIDRDLNASAGMLQLVVAGYSIAYALFLVIGSRVGDAFGRRRLYLIGMASFTVMSAACGLAPNAGALVAARALQGVAAALMAPQVLSTIQAATDDAGRSRAFGVYGATGGIAAVVGQIAGGLLVAANLAGTGWRPIFLVNVPIGIIGLILAPRLVPETRSHGAAPVDHVGTIALGAAVLALLVPLTEGRSLGWPLWTVALLVASPFLAAWFVSTERRLERRGGTPLVPMSILAHTSMRRGLATGLPFFTGFGGFMFVYALSLQDGAGFSPLRAGVALVPLAVTFLVTSLLTARLLVRYGRRVLTVGAAVQGVAFAALLAEVWLTWPHPSIAWLTPVMAVLGIGQGLLMSPVVRMVLADVPAERAGVGSGVLTTSQQISFATGVATIGTLYLSVSTAGMLGVRGGTALVVGILVVAAGAIGLLSRRLPEWPAHVAYVAAGESGEDEASALATAAGVPELEPALAQSVKRVDDAYSRVITRLRVHQGEEKPVALQSLFLEGPDRSWQTRANCMGVDPELFFPERGASTREAKEVCRGCVVREDCLEYAIANGEKFGIWGGMSERERRRVRRARVLARQAAATAS